MIACYENFIDFDGVAPLCSLHIISKRTLSYRVSEVRQIVPYFGSTTFGKIPGVLLEHLPVYSVLDLDPLDVALLSGCGRAEPSSPALLLG